MQPNTNIHSKSVFSERTPGVKVKKYKDVTDDCQHFTVI